MNIHITNLYHFDHHFFYLRMLHNIFSVSRLLRRLNRKNIVTHILDITRKEMRIALGSYMSPPIGGNILSTSVIVRGTEQF